MLDEVAMYGTYVVGIKQCFKMCPNRLYYCINHSGEIWHIKFVILLALCF